jgi:hypothetical protein
MDELAFMRRIAEHGVTLLNGAKEIEYVQALINAGLVEPVGGVKLTHEGWRRLRAIEEGELEQWPLGTLPQAHRSSA